jgi:hypothetical protein
MNRTALILVAAAMLAGCRGDFGLRCENPERYMGSGEMPPVRVPDDLSVPNGTEALRVPPGEGAASAPTTSTAGPCLESPPRYSEDDTPGPGA